MVNNKLCEFVLLRDRRKKEVRHLRMYRTVRGCQIYNYAYFESFSFGNIPVVPPLNISPKRDSRTSFLQQSH